MLVVRHPATKLFQILIVNSDLEYYQSNTKEQMIKRYIQELYLEVFALAILSPTSSNRCLVSHIALVQSTGIKPAYIGLKLQRVLLMNIFP
jgi:hypothetical protein